MSMSFATLSQQWMKRRKFQYIFGKLADCDSVTKNVQRKLALLNDVGFMLDAIIAQYRTIQSGHLKPASSKPSEPKTT